ncbi:MAG: hypothetical protein UU81_C0026G0002 [Microgenomates group bacterium GW2011_GWC1_41_8]|uniref:Uncharacterized protein n=2 Tax=Candidatus Roizmaniibacteriota TaxID=1752723 RepID=A0A0G0WA89_9BACT|nr:MAG: hypothetical protein UU14_C0011G0002 [Candidatus Roizmanbacteria bacterium GW2011_GWB1_40_7]KKR94320.1 MAG: hypothetical protein UU41_C0008G0004 [Candidatus Roizmanbacteria bacterium GW2011_GWA1_41_13]KKS23531.1 MAG: hypothetical protein UU81_C0026G0002 [Microgenomates group bacterium GW2011_GWC1_41_8]OGK50284.1 MAG: hypothetical protein A3A55_01800 [Candidatus Roizmanbacteria bacterium RIFCSPLOWO2_01_FULL_40_14]
MSRITSESEPLNTAGLDHVASPESIEDQVATSNYWACINLELLDTQKGKVRHTSGGQLREELDQQYNG